MVFASLTLLKQLRVVLYQPVLIFLLIHTCVSAQSLQSEFEQGNSYDRLRIRSAKEGYLLECGGVTYNFLEGFVFSFNDGEPPLSHMPVRPYTKTGDTVSWVWSEEQIENRGGVLYRSPAMRAEINLTTNIRYYRDGNTINQSKCRNVAFSNNSTPKNKNPNGEWEDMGNGFEANRRTGSTRVKR